MCHKDAPEGAFAAAHDRDVLPTNVKPLHYDLVLEPDLEKHTFTGVVSIDLDVKEETTSIKLNTLQIEVQKAVIVIGSKNVTAKSDVSTTEDDQTTTFTLGEALSAGSKATLKINFTGILNDVMAGFYRSSYVGSDGSKKWMATTQMEATDARRAFPCFDEPALKAAFTVTLIADQHLTCLSNMDVKEETVITSDQTGAPKKAVKFNTTPVMSTYLIAFIVGELHYIESKAFRCPVRVYAPIDQDVERGRFSLDLAAKVLDFYESEFDSKFPLPKMDMIAIPDFSAGAMENWGLVTYRIVDVLFDDKTSGASTKLRVAETVAHELAHQWFGNLVTMDFWDGLWLNEGFATWMSWYACNKFYPEWKVWESYVTEDLQGALSLDSLRSSHPIEVPIKHADEINQIFDAISYAKGSCVLRMISKYLGEQTFLKGIRYYLKKHEYGNTETTDLWNALARESGKDVEKIMTIWTKNVGFPIVTVTESANDNKIHVKQNRFLRTADVQPEEDKVLYPVFLGLRTKDGVDEDVTLFERETTFDIPKDDFYKINADHAGLYRTFYPSSRLQKLGDAARDGRLSTEDRAGMIADAGALAQSGYQSAPDVLNLLKGFEHENQFVVWDGISMFVSSLRNAWVFEDQATIDGIKAFYRDLSAKKAHSLGWNISPDEDSITQQFKALMFGGAGSSGDPKIIAAAQDLFARFAAGDREAINPNLRGSVYSIALQHGGVKEYDVIWNEYKTSKTADERNTALRSLGRAKDPALVQRTINLALGNEIRDQDIYMPLGGLRTHRQGIEALWNMLKDNWDALTKRMPPGGSMFGHVVGICTSGFTHQEQLLDVQNFFATKSTKGFDQLLKQSVDAIKAKSTWVQRDRAALDDWLRANGYLQ